MIYLILSVCFSTSIFVIFKLFERFEIDNLKAIMVNYLIAFGLGFWFSETKLPVVEAMQKEWFYGALFLGFLFILVFVLMAKTAQINGLSVASVAGKMSVVIPVLFGVLVYQESLSALKILGILLALVSVYLVSVKKESISFKDSLLLPILLFFGSGVIDTSIKFIEVNYVPVQEVSVFSGSIFGFAGFFAVIYMFTDVKKYFLNFGVKNLLGGILLGVPNYYSIIFLIKALQIEGFESSSLFTLNNVGIVMLSSLVGVVLFKEYFSAKNKIGVAIAILSIIIVAMT
ncbi:MAG: hypothetical protein CMB99_07340 [Flavobacteriaceae bacterium]|nr:hypothetical protein [Flavobacteriaceae bacterium]|tara:strand:+ start:39623 stop:40483 length:861 start_codon:yes stop_codon:yes gene_type:complete